MQKDLLESYGKYFEDAKVVLDTYSLEYGVYVRIGKDGKIQKILEVDKNSYEDLKGNNDYEWFKNRDFYSCMLEMNKSISTEIKEVKDYKTAKKMTSNNHLTLFFKNNVIRDLCSMEKDAFPIDIFKRVIEQYYLSIADLGENSKDLLKIENISDIDNNEIFKNRDIYINNIEIIIKELRKIDMKKGTRIRLFIDDTIENYEKSSLKYYALKIFNSDSYNRFFEGRLYGANNYNFGMNSKKPYNELKSTTYKVSSRIELSEIKKIRNMYIWFIKNINIFKEERLPKQYNFRGDFKDKQLEEFFLLKVQNNNGNAVIDNFEYIPKYTKDMKKIILKNYINSLELKDFENIITKIEQLEQVISVNWFSKCMQSGYFDSDSITSLRIGECYKKFILQYSKIFYEWFYKLNDIPIKKHIDRIGINITKGILLNELTSGNYKNLYNATRSLNIYLTLKEYLCGKGGENVDNKIDILKESARYILYTEKHISNEEEFCFLIGQISYYLISHSKAEKLTQDVFEPIINARNINAVKKELNYLYRKYKYEIGLNNKRFNRALAEVLAYESEERLKNNETTLLIGFLADNLFYEKKGEIENE